MDLGENYTDPFTAKILTQKAFYYYFQPNFSETINFQEFSNIYESNRGTYNHKFSNQFKPCLEKLKKLKIFDPAMGTGVFLICAAQLIKNLYNIIIPGSVKTPEDYINIVRKHIFGCDRNPNSIPVAIHELNNLIHGKTVHYYKNGSELSNSVYSFPNEGSKFRNNLQIQNSLFLTDAYLKQFNLIIGNPPYGNLLSKHEKKSIEGKFKCRSSEIAELFVELSLNSFQNRREKGNILCFILPKSLSSYQKWTVCRELILKHCICEIVDLGKGFIGVNLEQIAIIIKNFSQSAHNLDHLTTRLSEITPLKSLPKENLIELGKLPQSLQLEQKLIFRPLSSYQLRLLKHMKINSKFLPDFIDASSNPNSKSVVQRAIYIPDSQKTQLKSGPVLFLNKVPDMEMNGLLRLYSIQNWAIFQPYFRPKVLFKVLRGSRLACFADPEGIFISTEKIINFFPDQHFTKYLYGLQIVLNSRPASFYLQSLIFSQITETSRVLDPYYASRIPIPKITQEIWNFLNSWGELTILAFYHINNGIYQNLIRIAEIYALLLYFKEFENHLGEEIANLKSLPHNIHSQRIFKIGSIADFTERFHQILTRLTIRPPIKKTRLKREEIQQEIWPRHIEKLIMNHINNLLDIYHIKTIESGQMYRAIFNILKK